MLKPLSQHATTIRIAVLGTGRAGRSRIAAIEAHDGAVLAGCESLRGGHRSELADSPDVDAVIVCAENARHMELAAQALRAGKDVAVEFPLALSARSARDLYELANAKQRVLHVEVIGLLTEGFAKWRTWVGPKSSRVRIESRFRGGAYRWVTDEIQAGRVGQLATGRLHLLHATFGPLRVISVKGSASAHGYRFDAFLRGIGDQRIVLSEERRPEFVRGYELVAALGDDSFTMPPARRDERLFAQDLAHFVDRIGRRRASGTVPGGYVGSEDVIGVAQLADAISEGWLAAVGRGVEPG